MYCGARSSSTTLAPARRAVIAASRKPYATILDVVDAIDGDHSLITVASLNGLPPKVDLQGRNVYAVSRSYSELEKKAPWLGERVRTAEEIETLLLEVNAFDGPLVPPPTNAPWRILGREYVLALPRRVDGERQNGTIERGVYGTFHHVSERHLHRYCSEFDFRWDRRAMMDAARLDDAIGGAEGKRLFLCYPVGEA